MKNPCRTAFIFYAGVARFITQAEVGLWSILTASTAVFTTLTLFGLPVATQKYVSENHGRGDLGTAASISQLSFTIVAEGDLELLRKALPHQLNKILNMLEGFIIHKALALTEKTYLTLH